MWVEGEGEIEGGSLSTGGEIWPRENDHWFHLRAWEVEPATAPSKLVD